MDRYLIDGFSGRIGKAGLFLAEDRQLGKRVAVKLFSNVSPANRESLLAAGAKLKTLQHPNVVRFLDYGIDGENNVFFVLEYLDGKPLFALVPPGQGLSFEEAWPIFSKLADAIQTVHALGVLHLDLKPENVLMVKGEPKIIDFGVLEPELGSFTGTPGYVAPEIIKGETATVRSDIYSFGALMAYVLTGQKLYQGPTPNKTLAHQLTGRAGSFPIPELGIVIARATKADANRRYASIEEMLKPLKLYVHERDFKKEEPSEDPTQSTLGRWAMISVIGSLLLLAGGIYYSLLSSM